MSKHVRVAVTGAAGQIGYAMLFRIASGFVFGPDTRVDLHLLEITPALPALRGVAMELEDCAFPLLNNIVITDDPNVAMKDVNWAVLVGSMPRKKGMERADLLKMNGAIFTAQGRAINDHAASDVRTLVVGNPCNTNCLIAMNNAPDVPNDQFFAMTRLDQNRAKSMLAIRAGVDVNAVSQMCVWGNHSSTQYPDFYHAKINGQSATDVIQDSQWFSDQFIPAVQQRGAAIIEARGASSAASAANAAIGSIQDLLMPTPNNDLYSICRVSHGEYGVDEGLIFSFPSRTDAAGQSHIVTGLEHNAFGQEKMAATLAELKSERDQVRDMELLPS